MLPSLVIPTFVLCPHRVRVHSIVAVDAKVTAPVALYILHQLAHEDLIRSPPYTRHSVCLFWIMQQLPAWKVMRCAPQQMYVLSACAIHAGFVLDQLVNRLFPQALLTIDQQG